MELPTTDTKGLYSHLHQVRLTSSQGLECFTEEPELRKVQPSKYNVGTLPVSFMSRTVDKQKDNYLRGLSLTFGRFLTSEKFSVSQLGLRKSTKTVQKEGVGLSRFHRDSNTSDIYFERLLRRKNSVFCSVPVSGASFFGRMVYHVPRTFSKRITPRDLGVRMCKSYRKKSVLSLR